MASAQKRLWTGLDFYRKEDSGLFLLSYSRGFFQADYVAHRKRDPEDGDQDLMLVVEIFSTARTLELPPVLRVSPQYDESAFLFMEVKRYEKLRDTEHGYQYIAKLQGRTSQAAKELEWTTNAKR